MLYNFSITRAFRSDYSDNKHNRKKSILRNSIRLMGCAAALSISSFTFAIDSIGFNSAYDNEVMPNYNAGEFGFFNGVDNKKIAFAKFPATGRTETGAIIIIHGDTESYRKYAELIYDFSDLRDQGFSLYLMRLRRPGDRFMRAQVLFSRGSYLVA